MGLKKFCRKQGCKNLVEDGAYCESHMPEANAYDRNRESSSKRGYDVKWRKARVKFLEKHPLCKECLQDGRLDSATVVDHIVPHKGNMVLFWEQKNWQPLCEMHHNRKTVREDGGFGRSPQKKH